MKKQRAKGFTLPEIMIALALLSLVLALGYQAFGHLWGTYERTEQKWLVERDVKKVMYQMSRSLRTAYSVKLENADPAAADAETLVVYQPVGGYDAKVLEQGKEPGEAVKINETPVTVSFGLVEKTNPDGTGTGEYLQDAVAITVASAADQTGIEYTLTQAVHFPNLAAKVEGTSGTALRCRMVGDGGFTFDSGGVNAGCFIATAAYGDYDRQSVQLLRRFRDEVLLQTSAGQSFVKAYYRLSPPIAHTIARHPLLRGLTWLALQPAIGVAVAILHPAFALVLCLLATLLWYVTKTYLLGKKL
ncbi:MAG: CFI-box-CTERM domain-containing protein [Angelakisella sp.]|nr:CFI-box-CTERM domain-containing protein [Angelakisella sp.]